jgi:hypothetical protein
MLPYPFVDVLVVRRWGVVVLEPFGHELSGALQDGLTVCISRQRLMVRDPAVNIPSGSNLTLGTLVGASDSPQRFY